MRRLKILAAAAGERELSRRMRIWFGGVSVSERDAMIRRPGLLSPPDVYPFSAKIGSVVRRTLFFDQTSWLPDNLLERDDRMMMAGSIEGRMPFMDVILASVVARFPDKFLTGRRGGKVILRAAMAKVLPPEILNRKKIGFRVPFNEWFRGPYRQHIRDMLTSEASHVARICNGKLVRRLVGEHLAGHQNHEKILWSLTNLEIFLRTFKPSGLEILEADAA
jgi:asparagine synthase (glutamine-hydrolysing)